MYPAAAANLVNESTSQQVVFVFVQLVLFFDFFASIFLHNWGIICKFVDSIMIVIGSGEFQKMDNDE